MKLSDLLFESGKVIDGGIGYTKEYSDAFAKKTGTRLMRIFSPYVKDMSKYRIDYSDPGFITWKFYLPLIVNDRNKGENLLRKLLGFSEKHKTKIRLFVEAHEICVEIKVKKPV